MANRATRILVVEDELAHAEAIRRALEAMPGTELLVLTCLAEFRDQAGRWNPDIVLMDLCLPDGRATEVLPDPNEQRDFPILVMTSFGSELVAVEAMKAGAMDYLVKSREAFLELPRTLERLLREWQLRLERKRILQQLRQREESYRRQFTDNASIMLIVDQEDHRILEANQAATLFYGHPRSWLQTMRLADITSRPEAGPLPPLFPPDPDVHWEVRHRQANGSLRDVEIASSLIQFEGRAALHLIIHDVTERNHAVTALARSQAELRAIYDHSPVMMCVLDPGCRVRYANLAYTAFTGAAAAHVQGEDICAALNCRNGPAPRGLGRYPGCAGDCALRRSLEAAGTGAGCRDVEFQATLACGEGSREALLLVSSAPFQGAEEKLLLLCLHDITERRQAEVSQRHLMAQLHQSQKLESVGRLAGGVAHDINNMLAAILGRTELMKLDLGPADPLRRHLDQLEGAAGRSREIIRQLLAFSRKQLIEPVVFDLNARIEATRLALAPLLGEDIDLQFRPGAGLWKLKADPTQIDQVLLNLTVNARDAMPGGGRLAIETANVRFEQAQDWMADGFAPGPFVVLTVADEGCGIAPELLAQIFEPFFTTKGNGTGLGLSTVFGIVRQSGGFIRTDSEPGRGTRFAIHFPAAPELAEPAAAPAAAVRAGRGGRILVVEDNAVLQEIIPTMVERLGYQAQVVGTPEAALELIQADPEPFDLLLTDVVLPGMSGRELGDRVQLLRPGIPVLFMSGYTAEVIALKGVQEHATGFISKPFTLEELRRHLGEALGPVPPGPPAG